MTKFAEIADQMLDKALLAGALFNQFDQYLTDVIVKKVYEAGFNNRVKLARMAAEKTGLGIWQHKVIKNVAATHLVYESIKNEKTVGIISENDAEGITEIAQPLGPIFAIIPVTNPTSTIMFKVLIALKSRNPIIISPPRKAVKSCTETVGICYEAAMEAGAPEDCIQMLPQPDREFSALFMSDPRTALILATGGTGLVKAAYSSGNPALGVGPGNVPVFIDTSADIPFAIENIIQSKTFDNGTICASEQAIVCEKEIYPKVKAELEKQGCYFLQHDEIEKVEKIVFNREKGIMSADVVGQPVSKIANLAGIHPPEGTKILIARQEFVGTDYPLSQEILAPVLAIYEAADYHDACKICIDLNYLGGIGHTACVYANDDDRIREFSLLMNAGRINVNTPSAQGAVGGIFNSLPTSLTLGCGSGGKNITTENITARHLINVQRMCRRRENTKWFSTDSNLLFDEQTDAVKFSSEYHKNH